MSGGFDSLAPSSAVSRVRQQKREEMYFQDKEEQETFSLSFSQEHIWFLCQFMPDSSFYTIPSFLEIKGPLLFAALERSLNKVIQRHEPLRATFFSTPDGPRQRIAPFRPLLIPCVDLSELEPADQVDETERLKTLSTGRLFDLSQDLLLRATCVRLSATRHLLLLAIHHLAFDGWSTKLLLQELGVIYTSAVTKKVAFPPLLSLQYRDWIETQSQLLAEHAWQPQLAYWQEQLKDFTPLQLLTDFPRTPAAHHRGGMLHSVFSADLVARLKQFGQERSVTLFTLLVASFQLLLAFYTEQDDIALGTLIANRNSVEFERLIGCFTNILVLRSKVASRHSFAEFVQQVRHMILAAFAHRDIPYEKVVEAVRPERVQGQFPFFQIMLVWQGALSPAEFCGLSLDLLNEEQNDVIHDIYISLMEYGRDLRCSISYNAEIFEHSTVERLFKHWQMLLSRALASPQQAVADLSPLTQEEERQLLLAWNATHSPLARQDTFLSLFAARCACQPDAIALVYGDEMLSYAALDEKANQLAHYLRACQVGPEMLVGVYMQRSPEMLVSILATFKAGAAYVPLDPAYPAARVALIVQHAHVALVLTQPDLVSALAGTEARVAVLEPGLSICSAYSTAPMATEIEPESLAYVIYTSGSTGAPKGAMIHHQGMLNHLYAKIHALAITSQDHVAQTASHCFDISVWQFLAALLQGGRVSILSDEIAHTPALLLSALARAQISILEVVPSLLRVLIQEQTSQADHIDDLRFLRWLVATGEALPAELAQRWLQLYPRVALMNAYGPTECSDDVSHYVVQAEQAIGATVPIGTPVDNTELYILNKHLLPVPVGVAGELYVGGKGVGRGYLADPARTAAAFVPHPFSRMPGERLYRTGDLARYLATGAIEFLGRRDYQVKLRGFRIELEEIEHTLKAFPYVRDGLALVRDDLATRQQLVAYVVPEPQKTLSARDIQHFLQARLPEYMVPTVFLFLQALPLTPNGKIDRRALPVPEQVRELSHMSFVSPRTPTEELLAGIWEDVLDTRPINVVSNFFELGGHSLLATQICSRVKASLGVPLSLQVFFAQPTIEYQARHIENALQERNAGQLSPIVVGRRPAVLPLSFAQERLWFFEQLYPGSPTYNLATLLQIDGCLNLSLLEQSLCAIMQRHEVLRTSFETYEGQARQIIHAEIDPGFALADLSALAVDAQERTIQCLASQAAARPFQLEQSPLLRISYLRLDAEKHCLLIVAHHSVFDGWSVHLFLRELNAFYTAFMVRRVPSLPPLPLQYTDFALWQRQHLNDEATLGQLDYWRGQLADQPQLLTLPTDHPRPVVPSFPGAEFPVEIAPELTERLEALAKKAGVTLFMLLFAVLQTLLYRYTGQEDLTLGTVVAARNREEIEDLLGFFVNMLAIRVDLAGRPSFLSLLERVRAVCLEAYAHQDIPFERVVDAVHPQRELGISPLFQVVFALQNAPEIALDMPGMSASSRTIATGRSRFDLTLILSRTAAGLVGAFEYATDLFEPTTIQRYTTHYLHLLAQIAAQPERTIADYSLLTPAEVTQIVRTWNNTRTPSQSLLVYQQIEARAQERPDSIALVCGEQHLTYAELQRRANCLARYLRQIGVNAETPVGICLERSLDLVIAMLATLKAGGTYLPIDPRYPQERIAFMLTDARVELLLTHSHLPGKALPEHLTLLALENEWPEILMYAEENLAHCCTGQQLAYIIYTSGSTGKPKGVQIEHQALLNLISWHQSAFALSTSDRSAQVAGLGFDACTWEIWPILASGGCLSLVDEATLLSPESLRDWLIAEAITVSFLPTPLAEAVMVLDWPSHVALRTLLTGGDTLRNYPRPALPFELINNYGPTENTVVATSVSIPRAEDRISRPAIGRPIANTEIYLLDRGLQPVPVGISGELYIGGVGVARGYLARPELTAERFVPDHISGRAGGRLYKTGDLARYSPDGQVEFIGRADHQVKIRGYRIELEEIEQALLQQPGVREAVVLAREDTPGEKRLSAYIVCSGQNQPTRTELQDALRNLLPEYMVPAYMVFLSEFPLTRHGKLDRAALPAPDYTHLNLEHDHVSPHTPAERVLSSIWEQVLGLQDISIHDNFFSLGGDSILSIKIVALAMQNGWQISPRQLFQYQTIAELAAVAVPVALQQAPQQSVSGAVPLTPIQRWFFEQEPGYLHHWNQSYLLQVRRPLNKQILFQIFMHLSLYHDVFRIHFPSPQERVPQGEILPADIVTRVPLTIIDLEQIEPEERTQLIEEIAATTQASFDLRTWPLWRIMYFTLGESEEARLLISIHHLLIDNVSWRILLDDLQSAYEQLITRWEDGEQQATPRLPAKTTSYQDWSRQLSEYARRSALHAELPYWLGQTRAELPAFPLDQTLGENTMASIACVEAALSPEQTQALLYDVPPVYHTQINDLLLTALLVTLSAWTGQSRRRIDLEGHGREEILSGLDLSRTIGWFTSVYPVLFDLAGTTDLIEQLKATKELLRAIPQRGIGYGLLRYLCQESALEEELEGLRQAQDALISFNYQGQLDQIFSIDSPFRIAPESPGPLVHPQTRRRHLFEVDCNVKSGRLYVYWVYSRNYHRAATIQRLVDQFLQTLRELIACCLAPSAGGYTPSDFPLASLSQVQLDRLIGNDRQIASIYPLTPLQHGLLFLSLYEPMGGDHIIQVRMTLEGEFHEAALMQAWQQVTERYPTLRTNFYWDGLDEPLQVVHNRGRVPVELLDWSQEEPVQQQAELARYLQEDRARGFQLDTEPLQRLTLIRLSSAQTLVIWSYHHLILDGWSCPLVLRDILRCYDVLVRSEEITLPAAPPYHHYIAWLRDQPLDRAETFWREHLRDFYEPTPLNFGYAPSGQPPVYAEQSILLPNRVTHVLQSLARQHHVTLNTLFQCAWALLLHCYNRCDEIVFGTVVSGRPADLHDVESMVGLFINTLPVRLRLSGETPLALWLQQVQEHLLELRQYEYSPLVHIQKWSSLPRGTALFESLLVFENYPVSDLTANLATSQGILGALKSVTIKEQTNYPLTLMIVPEQKLRITALYDQQRFSAATIEQVLAHLHYLLEMIPLSLAQPLARLPLLPPAMEQALRDESRQVSYTPQHCLHELFEAQAQATPDALALVFQDQCLSYSALNRRADHIARALRASGVGPETFVGICVERSLELVVGILGILKAGGAYVPLDPAYPIERLQFILEDAHITALLTQKGLKTSLPALSVPVLFLDEEQQQDSFQPIPGDDKPLASGLIESAAYVIYTSGSTGRPKGVVVSHANVARLLLAARQGLDFDCSDTWTLFHSYAFDFSVWEIWGALLTGARLLVVPYWVSRTPEDFYTMLQAEGVTVLNQTPSAFYSLIEAEEALEDLDPLALSLRYVIFGGEALELRQLRSWVARHGDWQPQLINMYGITETTVHVTYRPITEHDIVHARGSSIGEPLSDLRLYVLDRLLRPVPFEAPGEMFVGGAGVARGYLGRPDLTAERFLPDPFSSQPGGRLYRSGDLARRVRTPNLEYLGRLDDQVKIRGFRIELGEIEAALLAHPAVRQCAVRVSARGAGSKHLVGYVVASTLVQASELRQFLQQHLPDYMLPTSLVFLESFPLTGNGKIDYRLLETMNNSEAQSEQGYLEPRTELEKRLAALWSEVLGVPEVSVDQNFFELGGDSIISIQIVSRARQAGIYLTPRLLFLYPTIEQLAPQVELARPVVAEQGLVQGVLPLTPIQRWFFSLEVPTPRHWNQAFRLVVAQSLQRECFEHALAHVIEYHNALRLRFVQRADGTWEQSYGEIDRPLPLTWIDLAGLSPDQQDAALAEIEEEGQQSLNLAAGPLLRVLVFQRGHEQLVSFTIHHLVVDGVSWRLLLEDLQTVYEQELQGMPMLLPARTSSYQQWAERLSLYAQSEAVREHLAHWLTLADLPQTALPVELSTLPAQNDEASARTISLALAQEATRTLQEKVAQRFGLQFQEILLAALAQTLVLWTQRSDLLLELEGHGREDLFDDLDISRTVGWFTTIYPVSLRLESESDLSDTLKQIKAQLRAQMQHSFSYGLLTHLSEDPQVVAQLRALPRAQVLFNYLGQADRILPSAALFSEIQGVLTGTQDPRGRRSHLFDINCWIMHEQLHMRWTYSSNLHTEETIAWLAQQFIATLAAYAETGQEDTTEYEYSLADFPDLDVNQDQLDQILALIDQDGEA